MSVRSEKTSSTCRHRCDDVARSIRKKPKQPFFMVLLRLFLLFGLVRFAPIPHGVQNRLQAVAQIGERVLYTGRYLCIDLAAQQPAFLHIPKLCGQHLLGHTADGFFYSPKRFVPGSRSRRINTFHLLPIRANVISTGQAGNGFAFVCSLIRDTSANGFCWLVTIKSYNTACYVVKYGVLYACRKKFELTKSLKALVITPSFPFGNRPIVSGR